MLCKTSPNLWQRSTKVLLLFHNKGNGNTATSRRNQVLTPARRKEKQHNALSPSWLASNGRSSPKLSMPSISDARCAPRQEREDSLTARNDEKHTGDKFVSCFHKLASASCLTDDRTLRLNEQNSDGRRNNFVTTEQRSSTLAMTASSVSAAPSPIMPSMISDANSFRRVAPPSALDKLRSKEKLTRAHVNTARAVSLKQTKLVDVNENNNNNNNKNPNIVPLKPAFLTAQRALWEDKSVEETVFERTQHNVLKRSQQRTLFRCPHCFHLFEERASTALGERKDPKSVAGVTENSNSGPSEMTLKQRRSLALAAERRKFRCPKCERAGQPEWAMNYVHDRLHASASPE